MEITETIIYYDFSPKVKRPVIAAGSNSQQ